MIDWNDNTIKFIVSLVYGSSFLLLFFVLFLWRKRVSDIEFMNDFRYLAIFGLFQGLSGYSYILQYLSWKPDWIYYILQLFLVSSSFAALLAFGLNVVSAGIEERRWLRGIPYGSLLMFFWLLIFTGISAANDGTGITYNTADLAQRYGPGLMGAVVSSYALFELSGKINIIAGEKAGKKLMYAGIVFALYALFLGINIQSVTGIPGEVYNAAFGILITISVITIIRMFEVRKPD